MSIPVLFRPEAEADIEDAYLWYLERGRDLGAAFVTAVADATESVQRNPEAYREVYRGVRRILLHRFPYGLFYIYERERVAVLACFHASRDPRAWQARR